MIPVVFASNGTVGLILSLSPSLYLDFLPGPTNVLGSYEDRSLDLTMTSETYSVVTSDDPAYGYGRYLVAG